MNKSIPETLIEEARAVPILEVWNRLDLPPVPRPGAAIRSPFREDKTPSLMVGGEKNIAYDFASGESLNPIDLVEKVRGCGFPEAVEFLTGRRIERDEPTRSKAKRNGHTSHRRNDWGDPIATYVYTDENGEPLFRKNRFPTSSDGEKNFSLEHWTGSGWKPKIGEKTRRVPYRLKEVSEAVARGERVYIAEGEKDVDTLAALGLCSTTNYGGAGRGKWKPYDSEPLKGARVCILPDNDPIGEEHGLGIAAALRGVASEVRIVRLPNLEPKGDVTDWVESGGTVEALLALVEATEPEADTDPAKVEGALEGPKAKPVIPWLPPPKGILPGVVERYIQSAADAVEVNPASIFVHVLPTLAGAVGISHRICLGTRDLWGPEDFAQPPIVWSLLVAKSGHRKSPSQDRAVGPLFDIETGLRRKHAEAMREFKAELQAWKAERDARKGKKGDGFPLGDEPEEPLEEEIVIRDSTPEKIFDAMTRSPRGLVQVSDEAGIFLAAGRYGKEKKVAERGFTCACHGARPHSVGRIGRGNSRAPRLGVSLSGNIPPACLKDALDRSDWVSGYCARFLIVAPPRRARAGEKKYVDPHLAERYREIIFRLRSLGEDEFGEVPRNEWDEIEVVNHFLTPEAARLWRAFELEQDGRMEEADDSEQPELEAAFSKLEGYGARFSLLIHLARWAAGESVDPDTVDAESIRRGIRLAEWFNRETERVLDLLNGGAASSEERRLLDFLAERGPVTAAELARSGPRRFRGNTEAAEEALQALVKRGLGEWLPLEGGRPSRAFRLFSGGGGYETSKNLENSDLSYPYPRNENQKREIDLSKCEVF